MVKNMDTRMLNETVYFANEPKHRGHDLALWFVSSAFKRDKSKEELLQLIRDTKAVQTGFMASPVVGLALMRSVQMNSKDIISCLLSEGASVNAWFRGRTMLHEAVKMHNCSMLRFLLTVGGIDKDRPDVDNKTPVMEAALGKPKCLKILLDAGCDMNKIDHNGNTALHYTLSASYAMREDIIQCLDLFLAHGADINQRCGRGMTCLHKAVAESRNCWVIEWLILHNCDLNAALIQSQAVCGDGFVLNMLKLNNLSYSTPLFFAIKKADRLLVEVLIACGARFRHCVDVLNFCKPFKLLYQSLKQSLSGVSSLQSLCRMVIRRHLSTNICEEVKSLGLPEPVQLFVLCQDELLALNTSSLDLDDDT